MALHSKQAIGKSLSFRGGAEKSRFWRFLLAALVEMTCLLIPFAQSSEIHGQILLEPPLPVIQKIKMEQKRQDTCDPERYPVGLVLSSEGGVKNAVISLKGEPPASNGDFGPAVLDQKNCVFEPHVLLVKTGVPFKIATSDPMDHEVRSFDGTTMLFNFGMSPHGAFVEKKFEKPGTYLMRCGLHLWMHAFVVAAENSFYAVSAPDGKFILRDVPPGKHVLKIWHETLGEMEIPLEVSKPVEEIRYVFPKYTGIV